MFQSSFELTSYITKEIMVWVEKKISFQSSFELTSYITKRQSVLASALADVSKLFRAYELYNGLVRLITTLMN